MTTIAATRTDARTARIVVLADDTPAGAAALAWAQSELAAGTAGRRLVLCRIDPTPARGFTPTDVDRLELFDPVFARLVHRVRDRVGGESVDVAVRGGHAATALASLAGPVDTIVVPAPPLGASSLVTSVVAHASGPFVGVRLTSPPADVTAGLFAGHVILGIDDGVIDRAAVEYAFDWADRHRKPLIAVHAAKPDNEGVWVDDEFMEIHPLGHEFGLDLLDAAIEPARRAHPRVRVSRAVLSSAPGDTLVRASAGALLMVVGEHRRNAVTRRLSVSVSRHVLLHARCTVAVVPNQG